MNPTLTEEQLLAMRAQRLAREAATRAATPPPAPKRKGRPPKSPRASDAATHQPPVGIPQPLGDVAPRQMPRHPTREWLIKESALLAVAVGSNSRTVAAVLVEMLQLGIFAPCPIAKGDPPHLQTLMLAIEEFARSESRNIDGLAYCADCISLSCSPPTQALGGF